MRGQEVSTLALCLSIAYAVEFCELRFILPKSGFWQIIHFSPEDIATLKARALEGGELSKASTFDALSGHVWQARTKAIESGPLQPAQLLYAVDIRERVHPPLPKQFCGNGIYSACARCPDSVPAFSKFQHSVLHFKRCPCPCQVFTSTC